METLCAINILNMKNIITALFLILSLSAAGALGGLIPSQVNVQMPKGAGRDDLQSATLIITWEDKTDPARYASPLPVGDACGTLAG